MTRQRKDEIERKVFYGHIESIMRVLEQCEDTHIIFQMGMEMGYLHRSLSEELNKEYEPQESEDGVCKDCYYNDGEVHAECVICDKAESEDKE